LWSNEHKQAIKINKTLCRGSSKSLACILKKRGSYAQKGGDKMQARFLVRDRGRKLPSFFENYWFRLSQPQEIQLFTCFQGREINHDNKIGLTPSTSLKEKRLQSETWRY